MIVRPKQQRVADDDGLDYGDEDDYVDYGDDEDSYGIGEENGAENTENEDEYRKPRSQLIDMSGVHISSGEEALHEEGVAYYFRAGYRCSHHMRRGDS